MSADLYVAPDGGDSPTIWRRVGDGGIDDQALLTRRGGVEDPAFDAFAELLAERERIVQLAAELTDFHGGHGDYLSAGKSLTAILDGGAA